MSKRVFLAGGVVALAVVGGGGALAATKLMSPKQQSQAIITDAAGQLGIDPSKLSDALTKAYKTQIDKAVADGRLTKAQGDALKARVDSGDVPLLGLPFRGFDRGFGHRLFHDHFGHLDAAATYLGMTEEQLRNALEGGKTLADVAKDKGKSVDGLVAAMVADAKQHLDQAVKDGRITQADANDALKGLQSRITDLVNGRFPSLGHPDFHFRGPAPGFRDRPPLRRSFFS